MRTLAQIISLTVVGRALKPRGGLKWLHKTRLLLKKRHPAAPCSDQHPSQKAPEFPVDLVQAPHTISDTCCQWEAVSRFLPGHWLHHLCQCHSQEPLVSSTELYQPGLWAQWLQMCSPFQPHSPTNPQHGCNSVKFPPVDLNRKYFFPWCKSTEVSAFQEATQGVNQAGQFMSQTQVCIDTAQRPLQLLPSAVLRGSGKFVSSHAWQPNLLVHF